MSAAPQLPHHEGNEKIPHCAGPCVTGLMRLNELEQFYRQFVAEWDSKIVSFHTAADACAQIAEECKRDTRRGLHDLEEAMPYVREAIQLGGKANAQILKLDPDTLAAEVKAKAQEGWISKWAPAGFIAAIVTVLIVVVTSSTASNAQRINDLQDNVNAQLKIVVKLIENENKK